VCDGAGNKIEVAKALTEKEKKKAIQDMDMEKKMQDAVKKGIISDDGKWEKEDKLQALKDSPVA
jgi:hypothetical protein